MATRFAIAMAAACTLLAPTIAYAKGNRVAQTFAELERESNGSKLGPWSIYISGAGSGFAWANSALASKGQPLLYCVPENLSLNGTNYATIAIVEYKKNKQMYDPLEDHLRDAVAFALLSGLRATLPCKK